MKYLLFFILISFSLDSYTQNHTDISPPPMPEFFFEMPDLPDSVDKENKETALNWFRKKKQKQTILSSFRHSYALIKFKNEKNKA